MNYLKDTRKIIIKPEHIKLGLRGNDLIIYSLIATQCKDDKAFNKSLAYIEDWTNCSRQTVINVLDNLCRKGLIHKEKCTKNGSKVIRYRYRIAPKEQPTRPPMRKQRQYKSATASNFTEREYSDKQLAAIFSNDVIEI